MRLPAFFARIVWTRLLLQVVTALLLFSVLWVLLLRWLPPPATLLMVQRRLETFDEKTKHETVRYHYLTLDEMAPDVPLAMIAAEDQNFLAHHGFDFKAMQQAFEHNRRGKKIAGGSTISQQVAKNVFLWQGRSYVRKVLEAYFTLLIEGLWGKRRILEMYCNVAETGPKLFGVEAAAQQYFHKSAAQLTRPQAALLASVLPNPIKYSVPKPDWKIRRKASRVQTGMRRLGGKKHLEGLIQ